MKTPSLPAFVLALLVIALPVAILQETDRKTAWAYVFLILLSYTVYNWRGLERFALWFKKETRL